MSKQKPIPVYANGKKIGTAYARRVHRDDPSYFYWRYHNHIDKERTSIGWHKPEEVRKAIVQRFNISSGFNDYDLGAVDTLLDLIEYWFGYLESDRTDLSPRTIKTKQFEKP